MIFDFDTTANGIWNNQSNKYGHLGNSGAVRQP